jgi:hypothetical protein
MTLTRQNITGIGLVAAVLTAVALAFANFGTGDNGGGIEYAGTLGGSLLLAVVLFGWVIPRTDHPARTGLVVGLLALLSLPAFWSGVPYVLGPAAIALGMLGRSAGRAQATAAIALGALATIAGFVALVLDQTM